MASMFALAASINAPEARGMVLIDDRNQKPKKRFKVPAPEFEIKTLPKGHKIHLTVKNFNITRDGSIKTKIMFRVSGGTNKSINKAEIKKCAQIQEWLYAMGPEEAEKEVIKRGFPVITF